MKQKIDNLVIVLTGATTDTGRPLAESLSRQGASLVLAGADPSLAEFAASVKETGAKVLPHATDVADFQSVEDLAQRAIAAFGRVDVWINNEATSVTGRFEDLPMAEHRRVVDHNLLGALHGARAVLPIFYEQGYGTLINNAALPMSTSGPTAGAYFISRHAIHGLGMVLRQEAELAGQKHIHISSVLPAAMDEDTNGGKESTSAQTQARQIAETILACVLHPRREVFVGAATRSLRV